MAWPSSSRTSGRTYPLHDWADTVTHGGRICCKEAEVALHGALLEAQRVRATAESANRAKDEFISTISHELRTPLNTIRLWARMLSSERLTDEDRARPRTGGPRRWRLPV